MYSRKTEFIITAVLGSFFMAAPVLFLEHILLTAFFSVSGFVCLLLSFRFAATKKQMAVSLALLWLAQSIRFSSVFGRDISGFGIILAFLLPYCICVSLGLVLESWLMRKGKTIPALICFPLAYTVSNIIMVTANMGNIQNIMIYGMCIPVIAQSIKFFGEYFMTFILAVLLSVFTYALSAKKATHKLSAVTAVIIGISVLFCTGKILLKEQKQPDYSLNVAVATHEQMDLYGNTLREYTTEDRLEIFSNAMYEAKNNGADMLVLCEEYFTLPVEHETEILSYVSELVKETGIPLLFCVDLDRGEDDKNTNKALFFDRNGILQCTYIKNNLVPVVEAGYYEDGGESPGVFTANIGGHELKMSCVICFDINDSAYISKIPDDTELLLVPSWDWDTCNLEQLRTYIRSIESNTTILKNSYDGFVYSSGPYGLYGDIIDMRGQYESVKMIEVPIWEK